MKRKRAGEDGPRPHADRESEHTAGDVQPAHGTARANGAGNLDDC